MRRRRSLRGVRLAHAAVGATVIAVPPTAAALAEAATPAKATATPGTQLSADLRSRRLRYGRDVVVSGRAPAGEAGQTVTLEFSLRGADSWHSVAAGTVRPDGRFHLAAPLRVSGAVRVTGSWQSQPAGPVGLAAAGESPTTTSTAPTPVTVAAALHLRQRAFRSFGPGRLHVHGRLLPGTRGRRVRLQASEGGRWHTVARAFTARSGRFNLAFRAPDAGSERLRVMFPGDRLNGATHHGAGSASAFTQSVASWYYDAGNTACGFHAYYGVASLSQPCGAHVTFEYRGRTVTATVDDRGPYVGGRQWDLNQNTASALGFAGVATVWSSE